MKFTIEFNCDNDAFGETTEELTQEVARIVTQTAERVSYLGNPRDRMAGIEYCLRDVNGNRVGFARFE